MARKNKQVKSPMAKCTFRICSAITRRKSVHGAAFRTPLPQWDYLPQLSWLMRSTITSLAASALPASGADIGVPDGWHDFDHSSTPLTKWFYAISDVKTRTGVSAKQLERELGVTYKTAAHVQDDPQRA